MRGLLRLLGVLVLAFAAFVGFVFVASEWGGEVVKLHTSDAEGRQHVTHLWIVEDEGALWLRDGQAESGWVERLRQNARAELEREGERRPVQAVFVAEKRERINQLMAERYGWVDAVISVMRDPETTRAIRLDPVSS